MAEVADVVVAKEMALELSYGVVISAAVAVFLYLLIMS